VGIQNLLLLFLMVGKRALEGVLLLVGLDPETDNFNNNNNW
jgi:hypothetical protein